MPETRSAAPGQKSPRWSAERRAFSRWRTQLGVPRKSAFTRVLDALGTSRVPLHPSAVSALRHPSGWMQEGFKPRAQNASREREGVRGANSEEANGEWRVANRATRPVFLFAIRHSLFARFRHSPGYLTS
jgi:hypothetical protein